MTPEQSVVQPLAPRVAGWSELEVPAKYSLGYPCRAFLHDAERFFVMSAVEVAQDKDGISRGPEYHISISRSGAKRGDVQRVSTQEAQAILIQFGCIGAEEDNHVEHGKVRNYWRPVADRLVGLECECKAAEPRIIEDKGDFIVRTP